MRRGDVCLVDLRPRSGSERTGRRPAVVVSNDGFNLTDAWRSIVIVPISSSRRALRPGPSVALLARGTAGLQRASAALCHQITTVDRAKLTERIGALPPSDLARVEDGIRAALDLD